MKNLSCLLILIFVLGCSKDDQSIQNIEEVKENNTSLRVVVTDLKDSLLQEVKVWSIPETQILYTNNQGEIIFDKIEPAEYTIKAKLADDVTEYDSTIVVKEGIQNELLMKIDVSDSITPISQKIEEIIQEAYNLLNNQYIFDASGYVLYWGDLGVDTGYTELSVNSLYNDFDRYYFDESNQLINSVWQGHYKVIAGVLNYGLSELKEIEGELSSLEKEQKAELMFLRGLLYFNMVKIYGNPIVVTEDDYMVNISPSTQGGKKAYDLIISDLIFAKENLPTFTSSTIASAEAATALLGKVYLQSAGFPMLMQENYNKAIQQFQEIEGKFSLMQDYADLFTEENQENYETIFKVDFDASKGNGGNYGVLWGPLGYAQYDYLKVYPQALDDYFDEASSVSSPVSFPIETSDTRFYQNIATFTIKDGSKENAENTGDWRPYKYQKDTNVSAQQNNENFDFIVLRYADVLLMKAEAINAISGPTSEAYELVNKVRRRAYLDQAHDVSMGLNKVEFLQIILDERKKEFFMEGHRKDDLIRTQMLEKVVTDYNAQVESSYQRYFEDHKYIWPIPSSEIVLNPNVKQNPGY